MAVVRHDTRANSDVYVQSLSAAGSRKLTVDAPGLTGLAWAPDGSAIVVGSPNGLWRTDARFQSPQPLRPVSAVESMVSYPSFASAPASTPLLAFGVEIFDVNLWRWQRDSTGVKTVRLPGSGVWENHSAFSPDGTKIVFASNRTGANDIWIANADGSDQRQLTFHHRSATAPRWAPDGRSIVFASQSDGNWDLYTIEAGGSGSRRLTWEPSQEENPSWSRDGRWIYFRSDRDGTPHVWKMPAGGGGAQRVTAGAGSQAFESADGVLLYFVRSDDASGLWSMPVAGGVERLVLPGVRQWQWVVTAKGIVFVDRSASAGGNATVQLWDPKTARITHVADLRVDRFDPELSATWDASALMWTRVDLARNNLMIIDHWLQ